MYKQCFSAVLLAVFLFVANALTADKANATATSITNGSGAVDYIIGTPEEVPFTLIGNNYNDNILYVWDENQNVELTIDLAVDRVADPSADYVIDDSSGLFIKSGTIVSSHYVQWDPVSGRVQATLNFDSDIFAFITADSKLFDTDELLGLPGIEYGDFSARGLESGDTTDFNGGSVNIDWNAANPGDWTRLLTAFSPGGGPAPAPIPEPSTMLLLGMGLVGLAGIGRKKFLQK